MLFVAAAATWLVVVAEAEAAAPTAVDRSAVSWPDADWPAEMGSLPLGNGDVSSNVWVDRRSGDLLLYLAKSDAFDINALPIKVGRVRVAFDPPLWVLGHNASGWSQTLTPATGTFSISTSGETGYKLTVVVDANAPVLRITSTHGSSAFTATATLEMYHPESNWRRNETRSFGQLSGESFNASAGNDNGMGSYCLERFLEPDTVVPAAELAAHAPIKSSVVWFHRNVDPQAAHGLPSYYANVMRTQGLDPAAFDDPLLHRTFGGAMGGGAGFTRADDTSLAAAASAGHNVALEIVLQTEEACDSTDEWLSALSSTVTAEQSRGTPTEKAAAHVAKWADLWGRSHVDISAVDPEADASSVEMVNDAYVWQRYLDLADGRDTWGVIKFNGQVTEPPAPPSLPVQSAAH